jgi:hypothetical protein
VRAEERGVIAFHGWQAAAFGVLRPLFILGKPVHIALQRFNAAARADATAATPRNQLRPFEQKVFSQQGEDGILREIFLRIGSGRRFFVGLG